VEHRVGVLDSLTFGQRPLAIRAAAGALVVFNRVYSHLADSSARLNTVAANRNFIRLIAHKKALVLVLGFLIFFIDLSYSSFWPGRVGGSLSRPGAQSALTEIAQKVLLTQELA
jgi:hypothetical protein